MENNSKILFVCDTPFQVLNAINFVANDSEGSKDNSDLYIFHQFRNSYEISKKVKETKLFNNVYDFRKYKVFPKWISKIITLLRIWFSKTTLKIYNIGKSGFENKKYDYMVISCITAFTNNLRWLNPKATVIYNDDGLGSYTDENFETSLSSYWFRVFNKFVFIGRLNYRGGKMYVNSPKMSRTSAASQLRPLPDLTSNKSAARLIEFVFDYKPNDLYLQHRFVYLTQPYDDFPHFEVVKDNAEIVFNKIASIIPANDIIFRVHPRQNIEEIQNYQMDAINNVWELECLEQINEESVLISPFSTAQVTPFIMFLKEPYLVFTYKLINKNWYGINVQGFIDLLKANYACPEKIIVPETLEELEEAIAKLST